MTLPHRLPITCPGAWCFVCGDPYDDCPTPAKCGIVKPEPECSDTLPTED